jgi:hypothetical protein
VSPVRRGIRDYCVTCQKRYSRLVFLVCCISDHTKANTVVGGRERKTRLGWIFWQYAVDALIMAFIVVVLYGALGISM